MSAVCIVTLWLCLVCLVCLVVVYIAMSVATLSIYLVGVVVLFNVHSYFLFASIGCVD